MDSFSYSIEHARLKVLRKRRDDAKEAGETDGYADLVRAVIVSERKLQEFLMRRIA